MFPEKTLTELRDWSSNVLWIAIGEGEFPIKDFLNTGNPPRSNAAYFGSSGEIIIGNR